MNTSLRYDYQSMEFSNLSNFRKIFLDGKLFVPILFALSDEHTSHW